MSKNILLLLCLVFSLGIYSQTNNPNYIWEEKLGTEKKNLVFQAVETWDTSFTINSDPIIHVNNTNQPFILLNNGNKLLFYVQEKSVPVLSKSVDVYSYTDVKLQDEQIRDMSIPRKYAVVFDFQSSRLIRLEKEGEKLAAKYSGSVSEMQINDQFVLLYDFGRDIFTYQKSDIINETFSMAQYTWNKGLDCDVYLVSLEDGARKIVKKTAIAVRDKFPFFQLSPDGNYVLSYGDHDYYAYNIATGATNCITKQISRYFSVSDNSFQYNYSPIDNISGWKDRSMVMVKDVNSDVWELDLNGQKPPVKQALQKSELKSETDENLKTKEGAIVTEKISWKTFDGRVGNGFLAKPKDFDPKKKYPILFIYYENSVVKPNRNSYGAGDFVDYGYLVFSPDIEYVVGETGKGVFNYVISAAEYLKKLAYVDSEKMGLRGASFGGYETNYLVTHSNLFAAAISMAGYTDVISNFGAMNTSPKPHGLEGTDQNRLGVTLWQRPDIWVKNSPIFYADRVTTPLLLIHSKSDETVPFEQSLAFFRALRSMGKRSWLLQYDDAGHIGLNTSIVGKPNSNCDMCTRQLQFFNHYLKGEPAPLWMLDGISAREKGKKTGLELDTLGRTPGPGLRRGKLILTLAQEELLKHRTMVTDDGRIVDVTDKPKKQKVKSKINK
jgi:dienelactone hydrolase